MKQLKIETNCKHIRNTKKFANHLSTNATLNFSNSLPKGKLIHKNKH